MGQTGRQEQGQGDKPSPGDSTGRVARRKGRARRHRSARRREESWFGYKRAVLKFVVLLTLFMGGFNVVFFLWLAPSAFFQTYLSLNAGASGAIMQVLGEDVTVTGTAILTPKYSLDIKRGCEALQVSAFFIFAVLAWPMSVPWRRRVTGLAVGTLSLLILNLTRIVSLYYTGVYFPSAFDAMHIDIWQPAFIVLALFFWVMWVRWVTGAEAAQENVVA